MSSEIHLLPDKTVFVQLGIFLSVLVGLSSLIFKPIVKIISARREKTDKTLTEIQKIEERIKAFSENYSKTMEEARTFAHKEKEKIRQLALSEESSIKTSARAEVSEIINASKKEIDAARQKAITELEHKIPQLAEDIIKKAKG